MKIEQLEYFIVACQSKNMSAASERCHVTQQTISAAIKSLEQEFEVTLLDRSNRGIELTEAGEFFLEEIIQILEHYKKLLSYKQKIQKENINASAFNINIISVASINTLILPQLLKRFKTTYPNANFLVHEYAPATCIETMQQKNCDIAILSIYSEEWLLLQHLIEKEYDIYPLSEDRSCALVNSKIYAECNKRITQKELLTYPLVFYADDAKEEGDAWLLKVLFKKKRPTSYLITGNSMLYLESIANHDYIGFSSLKLFKYASRTQKEVFHIVPLSQNIPVLNIFAIRKDLKEWNPALQILELTKEYLC